jgi:hypothetical protein
MKYLALTALYRQIMLYRAFVADDDENLKHEVLYYHNPSRWKDNILPADDSIRDEKLWSIEIKYLNNDNSDISDDIKSLPTDTGGVYVFFLKGINLPFLENHILYIGRCKYTQAQNIRKRALEYFIDTKRVMIKKMFRLWSSHLFYRYFPNTDNDWIDKTEAILIRSILPPLNEKIPDKVNIQVTIPAFDNN